MKKIQLNFKHKKKTFAFKGLCLKCCLQNDGHFVPAMWTPMLDWHFVFFGILKNSYIDYCCLYVVVVEGSFMELRFTHMLYSHNFCVWGLQGR